MSTDDTAAEQSPAEIAHDLNNELAAALANIGLARLDLPEDAASRERLAKAEAALQQAVALADRLGRRSRGDGTHP